jgi:heptosyltransferase-2
VERLIIIAPNWLGDAVMALPAIADVRTGTPGVVLAVAARASVAPLFALVPDVDEVITGPFAGYDTAILLPNSFHSAMSVARAGVRERWGYRTDWRGMLLTRAIDRPSGVHQIDSYQRLVAALGFANGTATPRLEISADVREAGRALLGRAGWDGRTPLVAIAPGAAYGSAKRWPPSAFADLAAGLAEDGVTTVMVGAAADRATAAEVTRELRGRATLIDVVGQTDIPALAGVLANCRALTANDSGALHLAAALGINVTAVFGPTDERSSAPRAASPERRVMTLSHDTWCRPCGLRECPLDHACMLGIPAADVLAAARKAL